MTFIPIHQPTPNTSFGEKTNNSEPIKTELQTKTDGIMTLIKSYETSKSKLKGLSKLISLKEKKIVRQKKSEINLQLLSLNSLIQSKNFNQNESQGVLTNLQSAQISSKSLQSRIDSLIPALISHTDFSEDSILLEGIDKITQQLKSIKKKEENELKINNKKLILRSLTQVGSVIGIGISFILTLTFPPVGLALLAASTGLIIFSTISGKNISDKIKSLENSIAGISSKIKDLELKKSELNTKFYAFISQEGLSVEDLKDPEKAKEILTLYLSKKNN